MRASYAFVLQKNNAEVSTYSVLTPTFIIEPKKNTLMQEYSSSKSEMSELYQIRKNYEKYMGKEMER